MVNVNHFGMVLNQKVIQQNQNSVCIDFIGNSL